MPPGIGGRARSRRRGAGGCCRGTAPRRPAGTRGRGAYASASRASRRSPAGRSSREARSRATKGGPPARKRGRQPACTGRRRTRPRPAGTGGPGPRSSRRRHRSRPSARRGHDHEQVGGEEQAGNRRAIADRADAERGQAAPRGDRSRLHAGMVASATLRAARDTGLDMGRPRPAPAHQGPRRGRVAWRSRGGPPGPPFSSRPSLVGGRPRDRRWCRGSTRWSVIGVAAQRAESPRSGDLDGTRWRAGRLGRHLVPADRRVRLPRRTDRGSSRTSRSSRSGRSRLEVVSLGGLIRPDIAGAILANALFLAAAVLVFRLFMGSPGSSGRSSRTGDACLRAGRLCLLDGLCGVHVPSPGRGLVLYVAMAARRVRRTGPADAADGTRSRGRGIA